MILLCMKSPVNIELSTNGWYDDCRKVIMEKDCVLYFRDATPPRPFAHKDIPVVLEYAYKRNWKVDRIQTPNFVLSILSQDAYDKAVSDSMFTNLGV